jgi:uncharacterized membrane protein HdeD (DUF308 family)
MNTLLANNWSFLVIRGLIAILLGVVALTLPAVAFGALVLLFGAYALIDGVTNLVGAWRAAEAHERWTALIIEGIVGILIAVVTIFWPAITALALMYLVATWALITGVLEIAAAIRLRKYIANELLLALSGVASLIFALILLAFPVAGALAIALWIGIYSLIFGSLLVALGIRMRSQTKSFGLPSAVSHPAR